MMQSVRLMTLPVLICFLSMTALGATYYVSPAGADSNPGSAEKPWATIQKAVDTIAPGDTILVLPGTYVGCIATSSGTASAPKTLKAEKPGTVVVNAPGPRSKRKSGIEIQNDDGSTPVEYWVVDGFEVTGAPAWGIDARAAHHIVISNCTVHDCGKAKRATGIYSSRGNHVLIVGNTSYSNAEHGIYVCNSADDGVVRGNTLYSNASLGVHMNGDVTMGGDGVMSSWVLEKNVSRENGSSGFDADGVDTSVWCNNLAWGNHGKGIQVTGVDGAVTSRNNRFVNNTLLSPVDGYYVINIRDAEPSKPSPIGNKIFNNILYHYTSADNCGSICVPTSGLKGFESDYNVVMKYFGIDDNAATLTLDQWRERGYDKHSLQARDTDLFVDPGKTDFHLKAGSPAVDAGTALSDVTDDIEGTPRPQGKVFDIGCYEMGQ